MTLKRCRECGEQISSGADICPHCGVHSPASVNPLTPLGLNDTKKGKTELFIGIAIVVVLGALAVSYSNSPEAKCGFDWRKCVDNEQLVNMYTRWTDVQFECKQEADKEAKFKTRADSGHLEA